MLTFNIHYTGRIYSIILERDNHCHSADWFVEHVSIEHADDGEVHFPLVRWIPANQPMQFLKFDSYLPHDGSVHTEKLNKQRTKEIATKQESFAYEQILKIPGMPRSVSKYRLRQKKCTSLIEYCEKCSVFVHCFWQF